MIRCANASSTRKYSGILTSVWSTRHDRTPSMPRTEIIAIRDEMLALRLIDTTIYLRTASINIYNGMISLTFSCDGSHYMRYDKFLAKGTAFWSGMAA